MCEDLENTVIQDAITGEALGSKLLGGHSGSAEIFIELFASSKLTGSRGKHFSMVLILNNKITLRSVVLMLS